MSTIVYLHGFASVGKSSKSDQLIKEFVEDNVYAPNLPIDPDETVTVVSEIVRNSTSFPVVFVGTSLGGFWANYFSQKFDAPCVIINPSINPDISMAARLGSNRNYLTGEDIIITADIVEKFKKYKNEASSLYNGALVNIFLAKDDDVINYEETCKTLIYYNSLTITETGGHRYDTKWDTVVSKLKTLLTQPN